MVAANQYTGKLGTTRSRLGRMRLAAVPFLTLPPIVDFSADLDWQLDATLDFEHQAEVAVDLDFQVDASLDADWQVDFAVDLDWQLDLELDFGGDPPMPDTAELDLGQLNLGSVYRLRVTLTKDGVAWTGIDSVTFTFEAPDRTTQFSVSATNESGAVWYYDTTTSTFDSSTDDVGYWKLKVTVVDGTITTIYPYEIGFTVVDQA